MVEQKLSKEARRLAERKTEGKMAKDTAWEFIYEKIAEHKKDRDLTQQDIDNLEGTKRHSESKIRMWQRIAAFKRKQAGA